MNTDALLLTDIGVHRMPWIRQGQGFDVVDLQPGINVVFGPNGCGKTTMARAIQAILWPDADHDLNPALTATFLLGTETWQVDLDGRHASWRRDGASSDPPDVGPGDARHRYRLALPELVTSTGSDEIFAAEVSRAMAGGFDLDAVTEAGEFGKHPSGAGRRRTAYEAARDQMQRAMAAESELQQRSTVDLPERERELESARAAERLNSICNKAIEYQVAARQVKRLQCDRQAMPLDQLAACHGNDMDILNGLDHRIEQHESQRREREQERDSASAKIGDVTIAGEEIPLTVLDRLEDLADELAERERYLANVDSDLLRIRAGRDGCLRRLHQALTPEQVETLSGSVSLVEAESLAGESHRLAGERAAVDALRTKLPARETLPAGDEPGIAGDGRRYLADWMAEPGSGGASAPPRQWSVLLLAGLGAILSVTLAVVHHVSWLVAIVPLAALAWTALGRAVGGDGPASQRAAFRRKYEQLQLQPPKAWTVDGVAARMSELTARMTELDAARQHRQAHEQLDVRMQQLTERQQAHDERHNAVQQALGVALPADDAWLPGFASNLRRWQEANDQLAGMEARIAESRDLAASLTTEAGELVRPYGLELPLSGPAAKRTVGRLKDLDQALRDRRQANAAIVDRIKPELAASSGERSAFFTDRGLADGDVAGLRELLDQLGKLVELNKSLQKADGGMQQAAAGLDGHTEIMALPVEEIEARRDEHAQTAARRDELLEAITQINGEIRRARTGHEVTDARRALTDAREALCRARAEDQEGAVGDLLLSRISATVQEDAAPEVFKRARKIFARITAGRFELKTPSDDDQMFRAYDSVDATEKTLQQLSTGERVQLLLSVRLGFLEQQERYRLPLLLDETLGTSDDDRVREIMNALVEIARDGRQILYFTAQNDEAGKWIARLDGDDVGFKLVDLGDIRSGSQTQRIPLSIRSVEVPRIASPDGQSHEAYGRTLGVPGLDPFRMRVDQVHPWHVVDDCEQLHALLERSMMTLGQFRVYCQVADRSPAGIDEQTVQRMEAAKGALPRLFTNWKLGRAKPIEMQDVMATEAVSPTFKPHLANLLMEVKNDPRRLLDGLEDRQVERWQSKNTQKMHDDFMERGILSNAEQLGAAELELRFTASLRAVLDEGLFDQEWIRRIVASLPELPASPPVHAR
ncbi:MAG: AAA family ATPase [Phycisphaerales bacterium]